MCTSGGGISSAFSQVKGDASAQPAFAAQRARRPSGSSGGTLLTAPVTAPATSGAPTLLGG